MKTLRPCADTSRVFTPTYRNCQTLKISGMARRRCQRCNIIESHEPELRWKNDRCPICKYREGEQRPTLEPVNMKPPKPKPAAKYKRKYPDEQELQKFRVENIKRASKIYNTKRREETKVEPGRCAKCKERKPLNEFSPRTASEPDWYPHHQRCKECVCESAKWTMREKYFERFALDVPTRTTRNLESELRYLRKKTRAITDELSRRKRTESLTA